MESQSALLFYSSLTGNPGWKKPRVAGHDISVSEVAALLAKQGISEHCAARGETFQLSV